MWTYTVALIDPNDEDNVNSDVVLPWANLVLDSDTRKFTITKWDELGLGPTKIRVTGAAAGTTGTVNTKFTIKTLANCPTK